MPRPGVMKFLITYDLPSTKAGTRRRNKVAKFLESLGMRVQFSVFELDLPPASLPLIAAQLEKIINPDFDSVRIYPICGTCMEKHINLGQSSFMEYEDVYVF